LLILRRNTDAIVRDAHTHGVDMLCEIDLHVSTFVGKFQRVADEVVQNLFKPKMIGIDYQIRFDAMFDLDVSARPRQSRTPIRRKTKGSS
jgi:hypothetical protein